MWEAQVLQARHVALAHHLGRTRHDGLRAAGGDRRKIACPDAEVWVVVGDGGFQMTMCELATIAQENIDINVAIINNGYLGMVRQWQEFFYERRYAATPLLGPNFAKLAEAFGIDAMTVTTRKDVEARPCRRRASRARTALIDFQVEQEDSVYSDGAGRRRPAQDDPPAVAAGGDRGGLDSPTRPEGRGLGTGGPNLQVRPNTYASHLCVYVDNKPGVLNRVASLSRRRASTSSR